MTDSNSFVWVALGVLVAVVLPVLAAYIRKEFPPIAETKLIPPWLMRYVVLFVFCLIVAIAALALWKNQHPSGTLTWSTAFLIGFGWESAVEKFFRPTS
jgi:hypothetical protein